MDNLSSIIRSNPVLYKAFLLRASQVNNHAKKSQDKIAQLLAGLHDKQRAFVLDPAPQKAALTTRRSGKTVANVTDHLITNLTPGAQSVYILDTRKHAKDIFWDGPDGIKAIAAKYDIPLKTNESDLIARVEGGGTIFVGGMDVERDITKFLSAKFDLANIDEAQIARPHVEKLIIKILIPTLVDKLGRLVITGTPGDVLAGMFYDVTRQDGNRRPGWSVHEWSIRDNIFLPHGWDTVLGIFERNSWDINNPPPTALREWFGRWARDESTLVYPFDEQNLVDFAPANDMSYVIGIDFGWEDDTAFVVVGFGRNHPDAYIVEGFKRPKMLVDDIATVIKNLVAKYNPIKMVADYASKGIVEEINHRHALPLFPAEKTKKLSFIELMQTDLNAKRIKVVRGNPILHEWAELQWADNAAPADKRQEDPRLPNHLSDAGLYAWREARHWLYEPPAPVVIQGTPEYYAQQEKELEDKIINSAKNRLGGDRPAYEDY